MKDIKSLQDLIAALDKAPRAEVPAVLNSLKLSTSDLSDFASWKDSAYTRNCLHKTATYELILLCWSKKCITAIHDHGGQNCWVYVLEGTLSERRYEKNEQQDLVEIKASELTVSSLSFMDDSLGFHRLSNEKEDVAYSLHIYAQPIEQCNIYNEASARFETKIMSYDTLPANLVGV